MIVLFDIDGTLTCGSRCGAVALEQALAEVLGVAGALATITVHGNIDRSIVREAATACGCWPRGAGAQGELVGRVLARYREIFDGAVGAEPYRPLPAAAESVRAASAACEVVGLATGNIEPCARGKLRSAGLAELFEGCIGGYGDEADSRTEVVQLAITRARARGARAATVLVVGDTPRDVAAARGAGAHVAAVATGRYGKDELARCGADFVFDDLRALLAAPPWRAG